MAIRIIPAFSGEKAPGKQPKAKSKRKSKRGGKRIGAGRKPKTPKVENTPAPDTETVIAAPALSEQAMPETPAPAKIGRPTLYSVAIADEICRRVAERSNLYRITEDDPDMPARSTIYQWLKEQPAFSNNYMLARELRADSRADRIDDITHRTLLPRKIKAPGPGGKGEIEIDNPDWIDPNAARVAIDAEKWQAAHENSKRYGNRMALTGGDGGPVKVQSLEKVKGELEEAFGNAASPE